jgi:16S rRNA (adenine1518-N6/adenine1519-N6)-dimethyltransferase
MVGMLTSLPSRHRKLGQHHLVSSRLTQPLLNFLEPVGREVVEVGAGGGVLTRALLEAGARWILALELDPAWALELRRRCFDPRLQIVVADALQFAWERLPKGVEVCGNLPYQIGTALLLQFLEKVPHGFRAGFLLQREVAERLVARPGTRAYGSLSALVQLRARVRLLGRLGPEAFRPKPKVESAFVGLEVMETRWTPAEWQRLVGAVRAAFAHPRKTLKNSLRQSWGPARGEAVWAQLGVREEVRAGELEPEVFLKLLESGATSSDSRSQPESHRPKYDARGSRS